MERRLQPSGQQPSEKEPQIFRAILFVEFGLGGLALAIAWLIGYGETTEISVRLTTPQLFGQDLLWGTVATLPMFAMAWLVERSRLRSLRHLRLVVRKLVAGTFSDFSTWQVALVSLAAGVSEEMFFRGILFDVLRDKAGMSIVAWAALLASSLLFGLAHAITRVYLVLAMLIGIYLAVVLVCSDSLLAPMVTHALYDFALLEYFLWRLSQNKKAA